MARTTSRSGFWSRPLDRDASRFGPAPPQPARDTEGNDWLNLAVWTPDPGRAGLPVVMWISGGGSLNCDTADPYLTGAAVATAGAVVVSANCRSGFEGFAHLEGAPENRALLDQLAALRWVQDNIACFGGDPDNVTVLDQSAGAGSIADLADVAPDDLVAANRTVTVSLLAAQLPDLDEAQLDFLIDGLSPIPGAERYRAAYPSATPEQLRETALSDWLYRMPALHLAEAADSGGARVWLYELCWGFGSHGASHGLDMLLMFGTTDLAGEVTAVGPDAVVATRSCHT